MELGEIRYKCNKLFDNDDFIETSKTGLNK